MQVSKKSLSPTKLQLTMVADQELLDTVKNRVVTQLGANLKLQGFRTGKAPQNIVERNIDASQLQTEFLEQAVNALYIQAIDQENVRPVAPPDVSITKFVPFTTLEVSTEVEVIGDIKLPNYKKLPVKKTEVNVTAAQVDDVIKSLRTRAATRKEASRAAKLGDEVTLDFKGIDAKTKEAFEGGTGENYPLTLGSGNFIPGFEEAVVGMKPGDSKDIPLTFPENYGSQALAGKKVIFEVKAHKVQELVEPKADDAFAATVGPFKTMADLKKDIRRELETQATQEAERKYESDLVEAIAKKSTFEVPSALVDQELEAIEQQERQDLMYRGQTWQEHLDAEGITEEAHREKNRAPAELRVKAGLILGEIAEQEQVEVTPEELEIRMQLLKGRYAQDEHMMSELDKPESRRDINSRLMTEKTLDKLKSLQN